MSDSDSTATAPAAAVNYGPTVGVLLLGIFFNIYLYGLVTYQFISYYRAQFSDKFIIKFMVLFLFLLDTFHSAAEIWMAWFYVVENYDNPPALLIGAWPLTFTPIGNSLASFITQLYLGWRIWQLSKSNILGGVLFMFALAAFIMGVYCGVASWEIAYIPNFDAINNEVAGWLSLQVVTDTLVTGSLGSILYRSRTGFKKTDSVINRLIRGAVQTGLFAVIFSLGDLVTFLKFPTTNLFGMFAVPIGRIYTNTLLDTLLSRQQLRSQLAGGAVNMDSMSGFSGGLSSGLSGGQQGHSIQLDVRKNVEVVCDNESFDAKRAPV